MALSRIKTIDDLLILRQFNKDSLKIKIPEDLKKELIRLNNLEMNTMNEISKVFLN